MKRPGTQCREKPVAFSVANLGLGPSQIPKPCGFWIREGTPVAFLLEWLELSW